MIKFTKAEFTDGEYELKMRFNFLPDCLHFEKLILSELEANKTSKEAPAPHEIENNKSKENICNSTLEGTHDNNFGMMWSFLLAMLFSNSSNHDGYLKGKCDAYESIFMPNKQEENMEKAKEAFAELKRSMEGLNKNDVSRAL